MKASSFITACAILLLSCAAQAQVIQSITITPAAPTTNDTITILAECSFFSGGCGDYTQYQNMQGSTIYASALHCLGPLAVICDYTDTFKINPLPVGNYTFWFQLDAGQGPSPCTPGIIAGPNDSINFTVTLPVGTNEIPAENLFTVFPNPATDYIRITPNQKIANVENLVAEILSSDGKSAMEAMPGKNNNTIDVSSLRNGSYLLLLKENNKVIHSEKLNIIHSRD